MANPALESVIKEEGFRGGSRSLELTDIVNTTGAVLMLTIVSGALSAFFIPDTVLPSALGISALSAFALSLALAFSRLKFNPAAVLLFATIEGVVLGLLTKLYAYAYDGVVVGAVIGTVGAFAGMLFAFQMGARLSQKGRVIVYAGMFGLVIISIAVGLISFISGEANPFATGPLGIVMSLAGLGLGLFSLLGDFSLAEELLQERAPESYKWPLAWGLLVSLVWIYTSLLRLLSILQDN